MALNPYTVVGHTGILNESMVFVHVAGAESPEDAAKQVVEMCQEPLDCVVFDGHIRSSNGWRPNQCPAS